MQDIAGNIGTFKKRHISGTKPTGKPDTYTYSIFLDWHNKKPSGSSLSGFDTIVSNTTSANWSYAVNYIEGTTTYNVVRRDTDGDAIVETFTMSDISEPSKLYTFSIVDDTTPPAPFKINDIQYTYFADVASKNYYQIKGKKEKNAGLFFRAKNPETGLMEDSQVVGFTKTEDFIATIYDSKPSGNLTTQDRNGNIQSFSTTVNIKFLIGSPSLTAVTANPSVINSIANSANLPSTVNASIYASTISWKSSRNIKSAVLKTKAGTILAQCGRVSANITGQLKVSGNNTALSQGTNRLTLIIEDEAKNTAQATVTLNVLKEAPSTAIILTNSQLVKVNGSWRVKLFGESKPYVTVKINGDPVTNLNNGTWIYEKSGFNPQTTHITLQVSDIVFNTATKRIWDKSYYSKYGSQASIDLPIAELSLSLKSLGNGIVVSYGILPSPLASLGSDQLRKSVPALSVLEKTKQDALSDSKNKTFELFAYDAQGTVLNDADLSNSDVKVALPFNRTALTEADQIKVMRYNPSDNHWESVGSHLMVDMDNAKVTAVVPLLGLYTVTEEGSFGETLNDVRVYPNPWVPNDDVVDNGTLETGIVFDHLTPNSEIKIYTISGERIIQEQVNGASYQWKGVNQDGKTVVSGVYLYIISDGKQTKKGKVTIIR